MRHPKLVASVKITLDKVRSLWIDFNALILIEEILGGSVLSAEMWSNMKIRDLRAVLRAALLHEDPALTEEEVGKLVHIKNLKAVMNALGQAWTIAFHGTKEAPVPPLEVRSNVAEMT